MDVILYATNHNPECIVLRKFFRDYNINYKLKDCSEHPYYFNEIKEYGFSGVPVTIINGHAIHGLEPEKIIEQLNQKD